VSVNVQAQSIQVNAQFDSTYVLIGDQVKLRIELEKKNNVQVQFPVWTDQLTSDIEIVEVLPVDSVKISGDLTRYMQDILVTSFDSGRHEIPPLRFPFVDEELTDTVSTRSLYLDVLTMPLDTTQHIADIKPIYQVPIGWQDIWPWLVRIGLILLALALIGFIIYVFICRKNNQPIFSAPKPVEPPHVIALRDLDLLRTEKLWQNNRIKEYYTRLSDIVRTYIEGRFAVSAMEMTSDEILSGLSGAGFEDNNLVDRLRQLFMLSDLVKFAKMEPMPNENETSMLDAYLFVNHTKIEAPPEDGQQDKDEESTKEQENTQDETEELKNQE
jgi:hypothetical protein